MIKSATKFSCRCKGEMIYYEGGKVLGKKSKLIKRLKSRPKDFTYEEARTLLGYFSYKEKYKGKTSGSRVMFTKEGREPILLHKPHKQKELLDYQIKDLIERLEKEGFI